MKLIEWVSEKKKQHLLFPDDVISYVQNPKDPTKQLLEYMNFTRLQEYKNYIEIPNVFL